MSRLRVWMAAACEGEQQRRCQRLDREHNIRTDSRWLVVFTTEYGLDKQISTWPRSNLDSTSCEQRNARTENGMIIHDTGQLIPESLSTTDHVLTLIWRISR